jgi:hypothetical protein
MSNEKLDTDDNTPTVGVPTLLENEIPTRPLKIDIKKCPDLEDDQGRYRIMYPRNK